MILVVFSDYLGRAYDTLLWPLLGFFFLPTATLAYALGINQAGALEGVYLLIFVVAVLVDLGLLGGSSHQGYHYQRRRT